MFHVKHCRLYFPMGFANFLPSTFSTSQVLGDVVLYTFTPLLFFMTLALL